VTIPLAQHKQDEGRIGALFVFMGRATMPFSFSNK
jgi:hypothetical protein